MPPHDAVARSILNDLRSSPDTFCLSPTASIASGPESIARVVAQSLKEIAKKPETVANAIALVPNLPVMCQLVVLSQLAPLAQSIVVHPVGHALLGLFYSCSVQVPTELSATVDNIIVSEARAMLDRIMKSSSTDGGNNNGSGKGKKKRGQKQAQQGTVAVAAAVSKKDASDMTILMGLAHAVPYVGVMISQRLPAILDQPAGLELVCGLADIPEIGSYIYSDWYELARDEKKYTAVISLIRVSSLVACLFELILPDFVALCKDANKQLSQCMYELVGVLNIPQMQQLCDRLMMFDGRGPSKFIELLTTDHTFPIAYRICESAESVTRVLLVDHLRTYSFYLRGMPHEDDIVDWATRNPTYNEVIVVYDKATSQFYTMDISYTENTFNRREWLRLRGKVVHLASVCINHQNGTCRANERCNMIHVDRDVIRRLRPKSCCALHGHEGSAATLARSTRSRRMLMPSGVEVDVPECRFARTAGWDANIMTPVLQTSMVCRQHQREACGKPTNCKFIHICREFWAQNGGSSTPPNSARDGNMLTTVPAISGGNIVPSANMYTGAKESHHHGSLYHSSQSYNNNSNNNDNVGGDSSTAEGDGADGVGLGLGHGKASVPRSHNAIMTMMALDPSYGMGAPYMPHHHDHHAMMYDAAAGVGYMPYNHNAHHDMMMMLGSTPSDGAAGLVVGGGDHSTTTTPSTDTTTTTTSTFAVPQLPPPPPPPPTDPTTGTAATLIRRKNYIRGTPPS
eukprot:PhM_4_TR10087/c3_g1_i3/m.75599